MYALCSGASHLLMFLGSLLAKTMEQSDGVHIITVKPVLSGHSKRRPNIGFEDRLSFNEGLKYCRMLQESILQDFRPS